MENQIADPASTAVAPRTAVLPWLGLALLLAVQYGLFRQYVERELVPVYARGYDQSVYLAISYDGHDVMMTQGPWHGLLSMWPRAQGSGLLIEPEAALLYLVLGPSRMTALTVNFLHLAVLELALLVALRHLTGRWSPGFLAVGLLLTVSTFFFIAGGIADYRIDFATFCLYATLLCVVLRGGVFASWQWSVAAGLTAGWLVWTRHLTALYVAGTGLGLLAVFLALAFRAGTAKMARRRLANLTLTGAAMATLVGPMVYLLWPAIKRHYITHLSSGEGKVRLLEFGGGSSLVSRAGYYFHSVAYDHAGARFFTVAAVVLALAAASRLVWWALVRSRQAAGARPDGFAALYVGLALLTPFVALSVYASPSPVVGGLLVGPLLLLVMLAVVAMLPAGLRADRWAAVLAGVTLAVGLYTFASALTRPSYPHALRHQFEEVSRLYERFDRLSRQAGLTAPRIAYTSISDALFPLVIQTEGYERRGSLLRPQCLLGAGVMDVPEAEALAAVRASDFVVINQSDSPNNVYPFVRCMREYRPRLLAACLEGHVAVGRYSLVEGDVILYARPSVGVTGDDADRWVTDRGLTVSFDGSAAQSAARIELHGHDDFANLGKAPVVHASLHAKGRPPLELKAALAAAGPDYHLTIDVPPGVVADDAEASVDVRFDSYFVPSERMAKNPDSRHLVMRSPYVATVVSHP